MKDSMVYMHVKLYLNLYRKETKEVLDMYRMHKYQLWYLQVLPG